MVTRGPREAKRRTISEVVHSQMLYAAPVWAASMKKKTIICKYAQVQRRMALRVVSSYRTVSDSAALVLASLPPIYLLAKQRNKIYYAMKQILHADVYLLPKQIEAIKTQARKLLLKEWQERWDREVKGRWTHRMIPSVERWVSRTHGKVNYYLTQVLTGHGCFNKYLYDFKIADSSICKLCHTAIDDVEHTLFQCKEWEAEREMCNANLQLILDPDSMVDAMLSSKESGQ